MRKLSRAGGAILGALAVAAAAAAFTSGPASGRAAAATGSHGIQLSSLRPGSPVRAVAGSSQPAAAGFITNRTVTAQSSNWAGYASGGNGATFRYVSADFYVPYLNCSGVTASNPAFSSEWAGLDGFFQASGTAEQTGILAACAPNSSNKVVPQYAAWWEMYPDAPSYPASVVPHPGDHIIVSVYYSKYSNKFRMILSDVTRGTSFTRWRTCPAGSSCHRTSAEVITEAPYNGSQILPLADFQAATFARIAVTSTSGHHGGLSSGYWNAYRITQVSDGGNTDAGGNRIPRGTPLDTPTGLLNGTTLFDDYYRPGT